MHLSTDAAPCSRRASRVSSSSRPSCSECGRVDRERSAICYGCITRTHDAPHECVCQADGSRRIGTQRRHAHRAPAVRFERRRFSHKHTCAALVPYASRTFQTADPLSWTEVTGLSTASYVSGKIRAAARLQFSGDLAIRPFPAARIGWECGRSGLLGDPREQLGGTQPSATHPERRGRIADAMSAPNQTFPPPLAH